jgi:hypothetical protein
VGTPTATPVIPSDAVSLGSRERHFLSTRPVQLQQHVSPIHCVVKYSHDSDLFFRALSIYPKHGDSLQWKDVVGLVIKTCSSSSTAASYVKHARSACMHSMAHTFSSHVLGVQTTLCSKIYMEIQCSSGITESRVSMHLTEAGYVLTSCTSLAFSRLSMTRPSVRLTMCCAGQTVRHDSLHALKVKYGRT